MFRSLAAVLGALALMTGTASALTVVNQDGKDYTIGVDRGAKESVHKIPANKTVTLKDACPDGCGVSGPWFYSWMADAGDTLTIKDGDLVMPGSASAGAASGSSGKSEAPRVRESGTSDAPKRTK
jgi:hypothetical protein